MTLTGGGSINKNTAIVSGPGSAFAVHVLFQEFPSGAGWGHPLCLFFCLQTVRAQVWPDRSKLSESLAVFLIFFPLKQRRR